MTRLLRWFGLVAIVPLLLTGCSKKSPPAAENQAVPVLAVAAEQKTIPVQISGFGSVEEYAGVSLKAQVTGVLTAVHFTEGQMVKKGDLLLSLDPRSFDAALKLAQANLAKDQVQLKNAQTEAKRQKDLLDKGFASQNVYDNAATAAEALRAAVEADKASVDNATLQVEYCSIRSPIDGVIGKLFVDQGNLVKENDITVVTIKQITPIYVTFSFRQESLPEIREYMSKNKLDVTATGTSEKSQPEQGFLSFIDNAVDATTGTILLRATFANEKQNLWPGQFVKVNLTLTNEPNAIVVPSQAVQNSQAGQFVYVVKSDNTVEMTSVTVNRIVEGTSVVTGLQPGQTVVTDGQLRLVPGAKVQIKNQNNK